MNQMMPPPAGAPRPPAAPAMPQQPPQQPMQGQMPPELAGHIDQNNPLQMLLLKRLDGLTPEEGQALVAAVEAAPVVGQALKKVLPEIGFAIDMITGGAAPAPGLPPAGGGMPGGGMPGAMPGQPPRPPMPMQGGGQPQRPSSPLAMI